MKSKRGLKGLLFLIVLLLFSTISVAAATTDNSSSKGSITIHYYLDNGKVPNIYYWNTLPKNLEVEWPGSKMESEGDNWYSYTIKNVTKANFLINYGDKQTNDYTKKSGEYWCKKGVWYSSKPEESGGDYERTDFRDESIYFVITTRFYDGCQDNNVHCWDENKDTDESDPSWRGDFQGLIDKLDYIKAMGFSAVWITPVVENCSGLDYHGYHAFDFTKVDSRYESEGANYQDLIDACHAKGMKIIQDVVFNHNGNFGEANLMPMFEKEGDLGSVDCMKPLKDSKLPANYATLKPYPQYQARLASMKDLTQEYSNGQLNDPYDYYHHYGYFNWDEYDVQLGQIEGDCVDLNTENPIVSKYLVDAYTRYINMGVDAFRVDTTKHISRLTFNNVFNNAFKKAGGENFFMFGEVCTKSAEVWYRGTTPPLSAAFYTWKDSKDYDWIYYDDDLINQYKKFAENDGWTKTLADYDNNFDKYAAARDAAEAAAGLPHSTNLASTLEEYNDNMDISKQPVSTNHLLEGNDYHEPDYSMNSGLSAVDFTTHWNFTDAHKAFRVAGRYNYDATDAENAKNAGDHVYNDATWLVTYVDSHDYAPDGNPYKYRFNGGEQTWAENLNMMFTFRGIPCLYYGSEVQFQAGKEIDNGPKLALAESGRAYFGDYLKGDVLTTDFAEYSNATGPIAETLNNPLAKHIQRLNKIRRAIPALRKGQYSLEDIYDSNGKVTNNIIAYKRRYTNKKEGIDSFVCVAVTDEATFKKIPNGTYTDAVTGDVKKVTDNTLKIEASGKGNMRVYVLDLGGDNKIDGAIGEETKYLKSGKVEKEATEK